MIGVKLALATGGRSDRLCDVQRPGARHTGRSPLKTLFGMSDVFTVKDSVPARSVGCAATESGWLPAPKSLRHNQQVLPMSR